jgi:hypothetical protein
MKHDWPPVVLVGVIAICATIGLIFRPSDMGIEKEVESLRVDLNQLTVIVSELEPVIVVDGQVAEEHFDWNVFHNVPTKE